MSCLIFLKIHLSNVFCHQKMVARPSSHDGQEAVAILSQIPQPSFLSPFPRGWESATIHHHHSYPNIFIEQNVPSPRVSRKARSIREPGGWEDPQPSCFIG